jgi:hypothetical protein
MAARRVQLGVGVGLVLLLGVVLALVLLRDPAGGSPSAPSQTTVPTRPDRTWTSCGRKQPPPPRPL